MKVFLIFSSIIFKLIILKKNTWGADLADMQLISNCNKVIQFLLFAIDILSNYPCIFLMKNKWHCKY